MPDAVTAGRAKRWFGAIGSTTKALVAFVASAVALAFLLLPGLSPDPHTGLTATMTVQTVEQGVTLGQYDHRYHPGDLALHMKQRLADTPGDIVFLRTAVVGVKHGHVKLVNQDFYWDTKHPALPAESADGFNPGTPNDQWIAPVWVPNAHVRYFARLTLTDRDVILAFVDSPPLKAQ